MLTDQSIAVLAVCGAVVAIVWLLGRNWDWFTVASPWLSVSASRSEANRRAAERQDTFPAA